MFTRLIWRATVEAPLGVLPSLNEKGERMLHNLIMVDLGPDFIIWSGPIDGKAVCAVTPRVKDDASARHVAIELVKRQGICEGCTITCPIRPII